MTDVIAQRVFRTRKGTAVVVRIHAPRKMPKSSEWSCKVDIKGLKAPYEHAAVGVDSLQALYLGLRVLCAHLDKLEPTLSFLDGKEGEIDTPLIMPWSYGPVLKSEMYRLINKKIREDLGD